MKIGGCIKTIVPLYLKMIEKLVYTSYASELLYLDFWLLGRSNLVLFPQIKKDKWTLEIDKHFRVSSNTLWGTHTHTHKLWSVINARCKFQLKYIFNWSSLKLGVKKFMSKEMIGDLCSFQPIKKLLCTSSPHQSIYILFFIKYAITTPLF